MRRKGWHKPPHTKFVHRPLKYGNPYALGDVAYWHGKKVVVNRDNFGVFYLTWLFAHHTAKEIQEDLKGWNLGCFCRLDVKCHADLLLYIANNDGPMKIDDVLRACGFPIDVES